MPARSETLLAGRSTLTVPSEDGVMFAVYELPEPVSAEAEPFVTTISERVKSVTVSVKEKVIAKGELLVGFGALVEIVTLGVVVSITMALFAASDPAASGPGRVRLAFVRELSRIKAPLRVSAEVEV